MAHKFSPTLVKVIQTLNDGKLHAGSDMAKRLGISRTAVWKIIQRLKKYNLNIEVQHQGYRLIEPVQLIEKTKIKKLLKNKDIHLDIFESVVSTSDYLKNLKPNQNPSVCLAEYQTNGRGRLGRQWSSPFGQNIYFSILYNFDKDVSALSGLSLVIGILAVQALEALNHDFKPMLKWPNDIYLGGKKAGGILIELMAEANGSCAASISIGLNVNMKYEQLAIDKLWTSLEHFVNQKLDRNIIASKLIDVILNGLDIYTEEGFKPFLNEWAKYDYLAKKDVNVQVGKNKFSGVAKGIDENGFLILETSKGVNAKFSSGDTTICTL
jgi:BirA family biotin operon repressor/biotin-[acetyl-CoA-carboxylase] ligase